MHKDISVLLPLRGPCPFLELTLTSIQQSDLQPLDVILIDDGIDESTHNLINSYNKLLTLKLMKNKGEGLVAALNTGLHEAQGKYIARIDNDDLMKPNRLRIQSEFLTKNPQIVAVGSNCEYINTTGQIIGSSNYPVGNISRLPDFFSRCLIAHPSVMYHLEKAIAVGGYRSVFKWNGTDIAEDFDLWIRLSKSGDIYNLKENLTQYRQHESQISSQSTCGQQIGSMYISALHNANSNTFEKISFYNGHSKDLIKLISFCNKYLGILSFFYIFLRLYQSRLSKNKFFDLFQIKAINRVLSYFPY